VLISHAPFVDCSAYLHHSDSSEASVICIDRFLIFIGLIE